MSKICSEMLKNFIRYPFLMKLYYKNVTSSVPCPWLWTWQLKEAKFGNNISLILVPGHHIHMLGFEGMIRTSRIKYSYFFFNFAYTQNLKSEHNHNNFTK